MKSNGSVYVSVVAAVLGAYFAYQWWLNPNREIKRRLGQLAAALSVPPDEAELGRVARLAQLRHFFAHDVHVRTGTSRPELRSRDEILGAISGFMPPPGGWNVDFVDVQLSLDSESTARAYLTVEMTGHDVSTGQATFDARDVSLGIVKQDGEWVVSEAEAKEPPPKG